MGDDCYEATELLYHYLDGELTVERREVIRIHLDKCPPCGDAFGFEAEMKALVAQKCRESVPEELRRRVADALRQIQE